MDQKQAVSRKTHFHIRWAPPLRWDSERFDTREEAVARANELKGPGEFFNVVEADESCARCSGATSLTGNTARK
jgi:hypothetical protein